MPELLNVICVNISNKTLKQLRRVKNSPQYRHTNGTKFMFFSNFLNKWAFDNQVFKNQRNGYKNP